MSQLICESNPLTAMHKMTVSPFCSRSVKMYLRLLIMRNNLLFMITGQLEAEF